MFWPRKRIEAAAVTLQYWGPDADILDGDWETAPTAGQELHDQIDETVRSDTDYIFQT